MSQPPLNLARGAALPDDVYEAVRARIIDNQIAPGARVNIDALARDLGVSPTPLREAMARLESDGLVTKQPNRGYRATPLLTRDELVALYELRLLTEPWVAARAAERCTDDDRAWLRTEVATAEALATAAEAVETDTTALVRALTEHDRRLHDGLARIAGNPVVREALARPQVHLQVFRLHVSEAVVTATLREHLALAKAVLAGRPEAAERAMRTHLERALRRLQPQATPPHRA